MLVGLALTTSREAPSSTSYIEPTPEPRPSATPTPSQLAALPVRRALAVAGESTLWRAEGGSCTAGAAPQLQTSTDAGATWIDRDLARYDVRQVLALSVRDANFGAAVVKLGDACELAGFRSFTGGRFWERADEVLDEFTYLDPDDVSTVVVAGERVGSPCPDAVQVTVSGGRPVTLCADGRAAAWADGAWSPLAAQLGAVAIVGDAPTLEFVLAGGVDCPLALGSHAVGQDADLRACASAPAVPARTVVVAVGEQSWAWAADWLGAV